MPRKGIQTFFPSTSSAPPTPTSRLRPSPSDPSFPDSVVDQTLKMAEPLISKWNPETTTFSRVTSLFNENRQEAKNFIKTINTLQKAIHLQATSTSTSEKSTHAKTLMQIAMARLQKEFYQILSMNRACLSPESVSIGSSSSFNNEEDDDIIRPTNNNHHSVSEADDTLLQAMIDLRLIAECMISSGYAKECSKIYKTIRKSIVDEGIYRLGVEKLSPNQIHRMNWEALESKIGNWLKAVRIAVTTLFNGERILCDHVFASSDSLRESCFADISKEGAKILFTFPEKVCNHTGKSPEKIFRVLDMYNAISDSWPDIDCIFSSSEPSTESVKLQVLTSLVKLSDFARAALNNFETAAMKDSSKSKVAGAGIHELTIDSMSYISNLTDYCNILPDILADSLPPTPTKKEIELDTYIGFSDSNDISLKIAQLVLILLCKLDIKAKYYEDISLSYLFLANNLKYVVEKVRTSNLKYFLGEEWIAKHESKVKHFASKYKRLGWAHVIHSIPSDPAAMDSPSKVKEIFKAFNEAFDVAYRKQVVCIIPDSKLRDEIQTSVARKITRVYQEFYNGHRQKLEGMRFAESVVRYTPEDVRHHLSDLFFWYVDEVSVSSSPSPSGAH